MLTGQTLATYDVVTNMDGSKAFLGIGNNSSAIVRFESADYITFTQTYTPFWMGVSADHQYAVSGQYRFSIIDFETDLREFIKKRREGTSIWWLLFFIAFVALLAESLLANTKLPGMKKEELSGTLEKLRESGVALHASSKQEDKPENNAK